MEVKEKKVLDELAEDIRNAQIPEEEKNHLLKNFMRIKEQKVNLMITGATGCGKSSTINALFGTEKAKVGVGVSPETMDIQCYELDNLILWDTPGLGDGVEADERHKRNIINKLHETDENGNLLIDLVLVVLEGASRNMGTSYELINKVIIPNLGENGKNRILVAINQADVAMKGRYWNYEENRPEPKLAAFLEEKAAFVTKQIKEGTGVDVDTIYYSAGYKEAGEEQCKPYNLSKLLYYIIKATPKKKRLAYVGNINQDTANFSHDDRRTDYNKGILEEMGETIRDCAQEGSNIGGEIGTIFGAEKIGKAVGGVIGGAVGAAKALLDWTGSIVTRGSSGSHRSSGGGGCYITTAVCKEYGKPDDCYELTMFRAFRDGWLIHQPDGPALIQRYYDTAPKIVARIDRQKNRNEIYRSLNKAYLSKCLSHIEKGENEACKAIYISMMDYLFQEEGKWPQ